MYFVQLKHQQKKLEIVDRFQLSFGMFKKNEYDHHMKTPEA